MSGRSAYVRKKITETKGPVPSRGRARSTTSSERDDIITISDFPLPNGGVHTATTGVGTTNARFLKFSEPPVLREADNSPYFNLPAGSSSNSQSGGSTDGTGSYRRHGDNHSGHGHTIHHQSGPLDEFAYARVRRPAIRMEDVSGIEKSGFRSALDKKSEEVRKGLAKTFMFGKKKKDNGKQPQVMAGMDLRPESSATIRVLQHQEPSSNNMAVDKYDMMSGYMSPDMPDQDQWTTQYQQQHQQQQQPQQPPPQQQSQQPQQQRQNQQQTFNEPWDPVGGSSNLISPPPSAKLPPLPPNAQVPPIKRWCGNGKPAQRWNKLRKDPELWDPNGDVLIYLVHRGAHPRHNPSFRLSSHIIEATESRYLITMLREGSTEDSDVFGTGYGLPPSPVGAPPMIGSRHARGGRGTFPTSIPTPPVSEDNNNSATGLAMPDQDGQISYEMYFPSPANITKIDQVRYHITTRNVFALLYHASLVGLGMHQALSDLQQRLEQYLPVASDPLGTLLHYMTARGLDDVRNDPDAAAAVLAWSESPDVRWDEGWREAFCHSAGMHGLRLEAAPDFKHVSPVARALLDRAALETQLRVQAAEDFLALFDYKDMWPPALTPSASPARAAADRLQLFFQQFYSRSYGSWPPPPTSLGSSVDGLAAAPISAGTSMDVEPWLSRRIVQRLQSDLAALYDYLVNRDVVFDGSETRSSRKWMMISRSSRAPAAADSPDLPLTDMLVEWDNSFRFPHIPSPMPLVPESIPPVAQPPPTAKYGKKDKNAVAAANANTAKVNNMLERKIQFAYNEATNIDTLSYSPPSSSMASGGHSLVDEFVKFEKRDKTLEVDPSIARRGRWVLIYGILQTLASVSVDAPAVRYRDGVAYHLCLRVKGQRAVPPWRHHHHHHHSHHGHSHTKPSAKDDMLNAAHELSHCWTVPATWTQGPTDMDPDEEEEYYRVYGQEGGKGRGVTINTMVGAASGGRGYSVSRAGGAGGYTTATTTTSNSSSDSPRGGNPQPSVISGSVICSSSTTTATTTMTYSESDVASSSRTPPTSFLSRTRNGDGTISKPQLQQQQQQHLQGRGVGIAFGSPPGRVEEEEVEEGAWLDVSGEGVEDGGSMQMKISMAIPKGADDSHSRANTRRESLATATAANTSSSSSTNPPSHLPVQQQPGSQAGPLILDFDILDAIDDHDP